MLSVSVFYGAAFRVPLFTIISFVCGLAGLPVVEVNPTVPKVESPKNALDFFTPRECFI